MYEAQPILCFKLVSLCPTLWKSDVPLSSRLQRRHLWRQCWRLSWRHVSTWRDVYWCHARISLRVCARIYRYSNDEYIMLHFLLILLLIGNFIFLFSAKLSSLYDDMKYARFTVWVQFIGSRALSYSDPYCQSTCQSVVLSFCLSVCLSVHIFQNASSPAVLVGVSWYFNTTNSRNNSRPMV